MTDPKPTTRERQRERKRRALAGHVAAAGDEQAIAVWRAEIGKWSNRARRRAKGRAGSSTPSARAEDD